MPLSLSSARAGWLRAHLERRRHLPLLLALAHQGGVAARAERQRERVEQDRLAGAGFAGEHGKPLGKVDVEPVDQDDVADGKAGEHGQFLAYMQRRDKCHGRGVTELAEATRLRHVGNYERRISPGRPA